MNGPMKDWDAMGSDWRGQAVPAIDVEALRAEATQQGRRLRRTIVLETAFAALATLLIGWIAFQPDAEPMETWLFGTLTVLINGDEEISSPGARHLITRLGGEHDVVMSYEGAPIQGDKLSLAPAGIASSAARASLAPSTRE